jgi:hypothetical protein
VKHGVWKLASRFRKQEEWDEDAGEEDEESGMLNYEEDRGRLWRGTVVVEEDGGHGPRWWREEYKREEGIRALEACWFALRFADGDESRRVKVRIPVEQVSVEHTSSRLRAWCMGYATSRSERHGVSYQPLEKAGREWVYRPHAAIAATTAARYLDYVECLEEGLNRLAIT